MLLPAATPNRSAARRILGALVLVCALAWIGPAAQARPRFPSTIIVDTLRIPPRASGNPGYLPLVGSPALRWLNPPATSPLPTQAPVVLYNPVTPTNSGSGNDSTRSEPTAASEAGNPPTLQPKDFLPFFQRDNTPPPVNASRNEGLLFAPARPALPTSSAEYRQQ